MTDASEPAYQACPNGVPTITVVLPTYNGAALLRESVESVLAQDTDFELIVCDDHSKDATWSMLQTYAAEARCGHRPFRWIAPGDYVFL